jgi:hypothetical protein
MFHVKQIRVVLVLRANKQPKTISRKGHREKEEAASCRFQVAGCNGKMEERRWRKREMRNVYRESETVASFDNRCFAGGFLCDLRHAA